MSTELSYDPPNSSGAMCIGVPTIVCVIIASGLQNPRSVRVPLLLESSCEGREGKEERGEREEQTKGGRDGREGGRDGRKERGEGGVEEKWTDKGREGETRGREG